MKTCPWCGELPTYDEDVNSWYCGDDCPIYGILMSKEEWNRRTKESMWSKGLKMWRKG